MRRFVSAAAVALSIAAPASADTFDVLYRNTLTLADTQGGVITVLLEEGGKFQQTNAGGMWAAGFWTWTAGDFCMTARGAGEICFRLDDGKSVGDAWEIRNHMGRLVWTARIVEGRTDLRE